MQMQCHLRVSPITDELDGIEVVFRWRVTLYGAFLRISLQQTPGFLLNFPTLSFFVTECRVEILLLGQEQKDKQDT